ncbi:MAG TPA: hypothetical protein PK636_00345 [bacterium]|nr:hypothetical protein [bacterium]HPJ71115.1 hypothetical protein [bacterium]HPQ66509.1 hypothetical protein [bacterium]
MKPNEETLPWRIAVYTAVPAALGAFTIFGYFFGGAALSAVIAPPFNREYGLLENLQALFLAGIAVTAAVGWKLQSTRIRKATVAAIFLGALFVLLEELDYGTHYFYFFFRAPLQDAVAGPALNLHNIGDNTSRFKHVGDTLMVVLFVVFPLFFFRSRNRIVAFLRPDRMIVAGMALMFVFSKGAHWLNNHFPPHPNPLEYRISEFRELLIYYLFLAYFYVFIFKTPPRPGDPVAVPVEGSSHPSGDPGATDGGGDGAGQRSGRSSTTRS